MSHKIERIATAVFYCDECGKRFDPFGGARPTVCEVCKKEFCIKCFHSIDGSAGMCNRCYNEAYGKNCG